MSSKSSYTNQQTEYLRPDVAESKMECSGCDSLDDVSSDCVRRFVSPTGAALCELCQRLHHEISCCKSTDAHRFQVEPESCRNSISWDEFFGSSLELAPSLLSIYDNLAASESGVSDVHHQQYDNSRKTFDPDPRLTPCGGVTRPCSGFWVTERESQQRLFVHACARVSFSGRPVSMMEVPRESSVDGEKEAKKRPLSISSLSSVSSTSLQRLQYKRPNLTRDAGEESCSDQTSQTSSDSNLAWVMADQVSLTSTDSGAGASATTLAVAGRCAADSHEGDRRYSACSSVDGNGTGSVSSDRGRLQVDVKCEGGEAGSGKRNPGYGSRTSSSTSLTSSLGVPQTHRPSSPGSSSETGSGTDLSSSPGGSRAAPVVMKPLQTTIRPVVISLPDSIRRHSRTSVNSSTGGDVDSCGSSVDGSFSGGGGGGGGGSSVDGDSTVGDGGSSSTDTSTAVTPQRSPVLGHSNSSSSAVAESFFNLTVRGAAASPVASPSSPTSMSSPALSSLASSPHTPSIPPPLSPTQGTVLQYPSPIHNVVQHHRSSPLSPTAIARRRFLASHFDIPDIPDQDPSQCVNGHDPGLERSHERVPSTGDEVPTSPGTTLHPGVPSSNDAVPVSSVRDRSPASPRDGGPTVTQSCSSASASCSDVSTPSPSPSKNESGFNISPCKDTDSAKQGSASGVPLGATSGSAVIPRSPSDYDNQAVAAGDGAMDTQRSPVHSPSASGRSPGGGAAAGGGGGGGGSATTSPISRSRSHKRQEGGGSGGGKGGSLKAGPHGYVSYSQRVVAEIVETERMYIDSLEEIIKGYLQPLERLLDAKVDRADLTCLFCNIRDIYTFGKIFLWDLEQCGLDPVKVAECFVKHNTGFVIYTEYCTNYPRAVEVLTRFMQDAELSEVCKSCQQSLGHGLPLGAYLLRPVQRILKYHLLLQNILKNFDKNKPGYATLEKALRHMTAMAHHINEMKRRHEHAVRIQEVQSQLEEYEGEDLTRLGELVLEGSFRVYGAKASRQVFLFEKGILITKKKEGGMLTCKAYIACSNLMLVEVIPDEPLSFHIIPFDNPRAQHTLQARSMEQKRHWCQEIKRLILESYKGRIPDNVKSLVMELGRNHDNDYVGKDSPWKHQHTAPEYLEKRRVRKKSGGKIPEFGPFLKVQRGGKRDQGAANKKSPKAWRKSDSKSPASNARDRSESLPAMLANASSASLPGINVTNSLSSESVTPQKAAAPAQQESPSWTADSNNNNTSSPSTAPMDVQADADSTETGIGSRSKPEVRQTRAASFKRAVRMQPLGSFDLDELPASPAGAFDSSRKMERVPLLANGHGDDNECGSSLSECEDSSDTDSDEVQMGHKPANGSKLSMYSSMPALNRLQRKPAQKRKGEGQTKMLRKVDHLSKSSEVLATDKAGSGGEDRPSGTRQYRRRWEGNEDGMKKKVPALHDTYAVRRSRDNLLRRKGLHSGDRSRQDGRSAKLTNWGSVDKLTHGSMSDLSHLNEDPWVKNVTSGSPASSPRQKDSPVTNSLMPNTNPRSLSMSAAQCKEWNPANWAATTGRPRNNSDAPDPKWTSGKENLDWLVYLNRNAADPDIRERASSFTQLTRPSRLSGEFKPSALRDSNSVSRSSSLCQETMKRYSQELPDAQASEAVKFSVESSEDSSAQLQGHRSTTTGAGNVKASGDHGEEASFQSAVDQDVPMSGSNSTTASHNSKPNVTSIPTDTTMTNLPADQSASPTSVTSPHASDPSTPQRPSPSRNVQQLFSPKPFSPQQSDVTQVSSPVHVRSTSAGGYAASPPRESPRASPGPRDHDANHVQWYQTLPATHAKQQPASPKTPIAVSLPRNSALSTEEERMMAEMQKYYEVHSPQTPPPTSKFPFCEEVVPAAQPAEGSTHHPPLHPLLSCEELTANTNRWSGVSSVSSSSNDGYHSAHHLHSLRDPNPNRLSGVSSISTSSYESQNSTSSDSLVGTLKNKISVWTHKLGGRRSRDEEMLHSSQTLSASRDTLSSPTMGKEKAELQEVLREHAVGSSLIGSRMANTLPVGFEPILSPSNKSGDQHRSSRENTPEPQTRFSFPSAGLKRQKHVMDADAFSVPKSVQQSDSGISMHSCESSHSKQQKRKPLTLPSNLDTMQQHGGYADSSEKKRRDSASSVDSADSFYERRLSVAFEASILPDHELFAEGDDGPRSPDRETMLQHRKSIKEVVQYIEEKFRPRQPAPVEVRRREPSALIRQRLQSLRDNSTYRRRTSNRSVSEDRSRVRESTPESPRTPRGEHRSRGNQFVHRVPQERRSVDRDVEQDVEKEREQEREMELVKRQAAQGRESEERSDAGSSNLSRTGSMSRLEQLSNDIDNLVIMRGWVRNLINKFQQFH